jgi:hypothetical protein
MVAVTNMDMRNLGHEPVILATLKMHDRSMVTALEVDIIKTFEAIVHYSVEAVGGCDRRDRATLTVRKDASNLSLGGKPDRLLQPIAECTEVNMTRGWYDSKKVAIPAF